MRTRVRSRCQVSDGGGRSGARESIFKSVHDPLRFALLEEGGNALLRLLRGADARDASRRVLDQVVVDGAGGHGENEVLGGNLSGRPTLQQGADDPFPGVLERFVRYGLVNQADPPGLAGSVSRGSRTPANSSSGRSNPTRS